MGREVRRVQANWQHPMDDREIYTPLQDGYEEDARGFLIKANQEGLQEAVDYYGLAPDKNNYMPDWFESERTHYIMYENVSEGTPISPVFATPEELARWLADTGASAFGSMKADYEHWLRVAQGGYAPSMLRQGGRIESGVQGIEND